MQTLVQLSASNVIVAAALALVAFVVARLAKRPALSHGLWLLVLLKLVTPPLWTVPVEWPQADVVQAPIESPIEPPIELDRTAVDVEEAEFPTVESESYVLTGQEIIAEVSPTPILETAAPVLWPSWPVIVGSAWLAGTMLYLTVAGIRLQRFRRLLRHATIASDELRERACRMAAKFHIGTVPDVWMLPGPVSPMLWAFVGRARILLPAELWRKLNPEQQATLLAHELAHLRRRDHWTRRLELIVTALYWWNPVVWLARREISVAEEQCCDAWVVWLLPETARDYALALMETVDFLSETRPVLPPAASGVGHVHQLRRRLAMIMRRSTPRALSGAGFVVLLTLALLTLPFVPTLAQSVPPSDEPYEVLMRVPVEDELPVKKPLPSKAMVELELDEIALPQQGIEDAKDALRLMQSQIEIKTAEMKESMVRLKQAQQRLERMEKLSASGTVSSEEVAKARDEVGIATVQVELKQAQMHEAQVKKEIAARRIERLATPKKDNPKQAPAKPAAKGEKLDSSDKAAALENAKRFIELKDQRAKEAEQALSHANAQRARAEQAQAEVARLRDALTAERAQMEAAAKQAHAEAAKMRDAVMLERARAEAGLKDAVTNEKKALREKEVKDQTDGNRLQAVEKKLDTLSREMEALRKDLKTLLDQRKGEAK